MSVRHIFVHEKMKIQIRPNKKIFDAKKNYLCVGNTVHRAAPLVLVILHEGLLKGFN